MTAASHPASRRLWTIMVYVAADNDLIGAAVVDLEEMVKGLSKAATPLRVNVVAMVDYPSAEKTPTLVYDFDPDREVAYWLDNISPESPWPLAKFMSWCVKHRPAEKYGLVMWGHGDGVDWSYRVTPKLQAMEMMERGIAIDSDFRFLPVGELHNALAAFKKAAGKKLDLLGFDSCMMGLAEINLEIADYADFAVSSPTTIPQDGWPYDQILEWLANHPEVPAKELAGFIVDRFVAFYNSAGKDMAAYPNAFNLQTSQELAGAIKRLGQELQKLDSSNRPAILAAWKGAAVYRIPEYIDLHGFCAGIEEELPSSDAAVAAGNVRNALVKSGYVLHHLPAAGQARNNLGLGIFFPLKKDLTLAWSTPDREVSMVFNWQAYAGLSFCGATQWDRFIQAFAENGIEIRRMKPAPKGDEAMAKSKDKLKKKIDELNKLRGDLDKFPPDSERFAQTQRKMKEVAAEIDKLVRAEITAAKKKRKKRR